MPPIRSPQERQARTLSELAAGTLAGTLRGAARPVTPVGEVRTPSTSATVGAIPFNFHGRILTAVSDPIPAPADFTLATLAARLRIAGTTDTTVSFEVNGVAVGSVTIPAGDLFADAAVSAFIAEDDALQARVTTAGTDADGLGLNPKAA